MLTTVALLAVFIAGWGLGQTRRDVNVGMTVLAVLTAVTAHSMMQAAFVDGRLDQALGDPRSGASPAVIVPIAAGEAIGLWVPVLVVPWARVAARLWGALYTLAAAAAAAAYHYFPFDLVVVDASLIAPDGPPYLLAIFVGLPVAALGCLMSWMRAASREADDVPTSGC